MMQLIRADLYRLKKSRAFFLSLAGMLLLASGLMAVQATAMDYTVPLSRVVFLPLSLYGLGAAAFVSVFVGTDFSGGFIRNKLIAAKTRGGIVLSQLLTSCAACICIYAVTTFYSLGVGSFFFENDVTAGAFISFFLLGIGMSAAIGCLFSVTALVCADKTNGVIWCMGIAFVMLFLCLHTNGLLVQTEYRDGALNPHYAGGFRRALYGVLHDLNPYGQAAQLSAWEVWNPARAAACNLLWITGMSYAGCALFQRKDVR